MYNSSEAATRRASVITGARVVCRWSCQTNGQKESTSKGKCSHLSLLSFTLSRQFKSWEITKGISKNYK